MSSIRTHPDINSTLRSDLGFLNMDQFAFTVFMKFLIFPLQLFHLHFKKCAVEWKTIISFLISSVPTSLEKHKGEHIEPMKPEEPMELKLKDR